VSAAPLSSSAGARTCALMRLRVICTSPDSPASVTAHDASTTGAACGPLMLAVTLV